ncbi:methionine--tRNA ligase MSM1 [Aspergillus nidulans FGSC A4]|uniref:Probable methionine--tRNA ligase, mitochondrial n=1 Tax=Emericella nidulans (strain FGSC A4 / ATCC 38163 / CBS 112.46 / NRRL 194 / M139) TaxID=227321 RepID=C8V6G5_EMENI|nr:methionine--tRNA ligase MSM1 [Aspergillus nidulans FGSC A4]CBF75211.1 TPA: methionyl-tRNA synthetase, putative (AFU_orthologue; AFUA_4G07820) [Aspergillus nidulans FGSC A4]
MASLRGGSRALSWANQLLSRQRLSSKCASQRVAPPATAYSLRQYATTAKEASKPYYVTTPIFYVNAAPHVGHLYTMVLADILKRWRTLTGDNEAQLLTGTDEHGMKIQQAANAAGIDTQAFCDRNCLTFKALAEAANVDYNYFIRTTEPAHKEAVQYFWEMLQHRGYIYTSKHEGWYSVSDETFYPQSQVNLSLDPATGRKRMVSTETGKEVEWSSETNYHFRLSAFQDRLLELYKTDFITPTHYTEQVVKSVASGLSDLSISRPVERLTWGIPVPNDNTQTIYVWLDALVNYLTKAGYPFPPGEGSRLGWPADVHVVGKDIVRFHCVYWPAFLMALDLPLPRNVLVHAHWTMNREKMSKSTGNVVNPFFAIDRFGMDTMRFFLAHRGGLASDSDYDNRYIIRDYKKYLQQGLGNIAHRTIGCAKGKLRDYIINATSGNSPATADDQAYQKTLEQLSHKVAKCMEALDPRAALEEIVEVILLTNKYFHNSEPWQNPEEKQRVIFNAAESMRIMGILLQPFMPNKAKKLLDILKVDPSKRDLSDAGYARDSTYGEDVKKKILFPPLALEN